MRRRILLIGGLSLAMAACTRKQSLYLHPGRQDEPPPRRAPGPADGRSVQAAAPAADYPENT